MELTGTVLNVVDFGCFVDIGMHDSGLVHVSRLADRFIRDPHEVVAVGDIVKVWVMEVDKERRRVSLTMVRPGSERPRVRPGGEGGPSDRARSRRRTGRPGPGGQDQRRATGRSSAARRPRPAGWTPRPARRPAESAGRSSDNRAVGRKVADRRAARPKAAGRQGGRPQQAGAPQQGGRPQGEGGPGGKPRDDRRGGYGGPPSRRPRPQGPGQGRPHEFKPKPKPLIPITDAMKKGKEPMRTFGDLMQFFGTKTRQKPPAEQPAESKQRAKHEAGRAAGRDGGPGGDGARCLRNRAGDSAPVAGARSPSLPNPRPSPAAPSAEHSPAGHGLVAGNANCFGLRRT